MNREVIAVVNHKGGVGKTTSSVNIAACLGEKGKKGLLIDMDPQGSASLFLGIQDNGASFLQALQATAPLPWRPTKAPGVDLVPSGPDLAAARERFSGAIGADLLSRCLARTDGQWEWVLVDCPPGLEVLTINALRAARHVIVPVEASYLALHGISQILETVQELVNAGCDLKIRAVVPCRAHPRRRVHQEVMKVIESEFPGLVTPIVRECVALVEASGRKGPVVITAPRSSGAVDYRAVTDWLVARLSQARTP